MKNKKFIFLACLLMSLSACDIVDLEEKPESFIAPAQFFNSDQEAESAIYGVYDFYHNPRIGDYFWFFYGDLGTDVAMTRTIATYSFQHGDMVTVSTHMRHTWRVFYQAIGAANMVIARVDASENISDDVKRRIVAEARFLRGSFYNRLNLLFGNVPVWLDELDLDHVENLGATPANEVREQVIEDLTYAANNLPETVSEAGRVSSWVAKGLLARVSLFANDWQNAKDMAADVINNSGHSLLPNYYDVFDWTNKMNNELIHVVPKAPDLKGSAMHSFSSPRPFDDNNNFDIPDGEAVIRPDGQLSTDKASRNPGSLFQGWGIFQTVKENYDSYEEGDTRKDMWWHELEFTDGSTFTFTGGGSMGLPGRSGYYPLKWIAFDEAPNNGGRDTHYQRLAELYLILAESENELNGPTSVAYEAINTVRRRAFGGLDHDLIGMSKDEFRQAVIDENRWELGGEGLRRWYLWHWGYDTFLQAAEFVSETNPRLLDNIQPHHKWHRIPDEEIINNPNLRQNPGY